MKQSLYRLFCLLLCAVMVVGMIPATASAAGKDKYPTEYEETIVTTQIDGYEVSIGEDGIYTCTPTTIEKERSVIVPKSDDAKNSFSAKNAITEYEPDEIHFETFEDLKKLASRTYEEWTYVCYEGTEDLVISESLTLPNNMDLYIENGEDLIIPAGVTLNVIGDLQVYYGGLTVAGTLILNGYVSFSGNVTVTGAVQSQRSISLIYSNDLIGLENIQFTEEWSSFRYSCDAETLDEVKEVVAAATANPKNDYSIYLYLTEDLVFSSSLTFPPNTYIASTDPATKIIVNAGISLTINGDASIDSPMIIQGNLVNNGTFRYYGNENDTVMEFTSTGSYSGNGHLLIYVNDDDTNYTPYITGLDTTNLDIVEYQDEDIHYWQIRDPSNLIQLSAPTNLEWHKEETWIYDEETGENENKVVTSYGTLRFKAGPVLEESDSYTVFHVILYKGDQPVFSSVYSYSNDDLMAGSYIYAYPHDEIEYESGEYYFTVQAMATSIDYMDSPIVTSSTWTYTKPEEKCARPTNAKWKDGPNAVWEPASENLRARIRFYYAPTQNATPEFISSYENDEMISYEIPDYDLLYYGPGYYYFKVQTLSPDIVTKANSSWTSLSKAYHYTGEERPVKPGMEVFYDNFWECPRVEIKRSPGANRYEIYRATSRDGTYKKIDTVEIYNSHWYPYYDTATTVGKTYYYKVRAISYTGVKSYFCDVDYCRIKLSSPEATITNDASSGKPVVEWESVEGASKYYIYRATSKTGDFKKVKTAVTARSYKDTETKAGKVYYYYVVAVHEKSAYNSTPSEVVYTRCDLKRPVVSISNTSAGYPYLKWSAISGAKKYEIYRATSKSGTYKKIGTTTSTKYTDKKATEGKRYYYRVKAIHSSSGANSAYSATDSIKAK